MTYLFFLPRFDFFFARAGSFAYLFLVMPFMYSSATVGGMSPFPRPAAAAAIARACAFDFGGIA